MAWLKSVVVTFLTSLASMIWASFYEWLKEQWANKAKQKNTEENKAIKEQVENAKTTAEKQAALDAAARKHGRNP